MSGEVVVQGLKIQGGSGVVSGGGFLVKSGSTLFLEGVEVRDNSATNNGGGGTVNPDGRLWIIGSTTVLSTGGNIESPGDTCGLNPAIDQVNVADPGLWPLGYYGGTTPTLVPEPTSPAVDDPLGVLGACYGNDQRGLPRSVDGNGDGVVSCDSGAVERQPDEAELFFDGFESGDTSGW